MLIIYTCIQLLYFDPNLGKYSHLILRFMKYELLVILHLMLTRKPQNTLPEKEKISFHPRMILMRFYQFRFHEFVSLKAFPRNQRNPESRRLLLLGGLFLEVALRGGQTVLQEKVLSITPGHRKDSGVLQCVRRDDK